MRRHFPGIIAVLVVMVIGSMATAETITQNLSYDDTPDFQQVLTFDKFDDLGGLLTLQSVYVEVSLDANGGALRCDNDAVTSASGAIEFGAQVAVSSTTVSLVDMTLNPIFQPGDVKATGSTTLNLTADDGDTEQPGGTDDFSSQGTDYGDYTGGLASGGDSGYVTSGAFAQYTGTGTYTIQLDASQVANYGSLGGVQAQIDPLTASGEVTVIYTYFPEPATVGLLALGSLVLTRRRRTA